MRVGVDATLVSERLTGAGRFIVGLLGAMPRVSPSVQVTAFALPGSAGRLAGLKGIDVEVVGPRSGFTWELWGMGRAARAADVDVLLAVREIVGFGKTPTVMEVFEPPSMRVRDRTGASWKARRKDQLLALAFPVAIRRAAKVVAGGYETSDWLKERFGIAAPVVPPGIEPVFLELVELGRATLDPYFLHIASGDGRDNTPLVLDAFGRLQTLARLVLVGAPTSFVPSLERLVAGSTASSRVEIRGWVTDEELRLLYRGAIALIFPSRFEAFAGYPALEALCQETPVICLDTPGSSPLRGYAIILRDENPDGLAAAMADIEGDPDERDRLGRRGREQMSKLSWENTARMFLELLSEVAG